MRKCLTLSISFVLPLLLALPALAQTGAAVRLDTMLNADTGKYRVEGATGPEEKDAIKAAKHAAVDFAARSLTGDPGQKTSAAQHVKHNLGQMLGFASAGKIYRRGFDDSGENMSINIFIEVNNQALQRNLIEAGVISSSRDIAKGAGKPEIMVFYAQGDCDKGKEHAPLCVLPNRIKEAAKGVEKVENKIMEYQKSLIDAGCLIATETSVESSHESRDKSKGKASYGRSSSGRSGGSYSASRYHASGSGSSSHRSSSRGKYSVALDRESVSKFSAKSIKASSNCKKFLGRVDSMTGELYKAMRKRDSLQDELETVRKGLFENDVTTIRVNEWFVNQRWEVVDAEAVRKAQRALDAMTSTEGLPQDPAAATALMAGADIYLEHDLVESRPNGGYQVNVTIKAYEVVSGKLLASKVGKSNVLASPDKMNAVEKAVGRAMGKILDQITGYWSDMAREGLKTKIVIRGDFTNSDVSDDIDEFIDEALADEIGRRCKDLCEWDPKLSTKGTIMGNYISPAKARKKIGKKLRRLLKGEGFGVSKIVEKPSLHVMEVYF